MNALSLDLRQRIVRAVDGGVSQSEAARRFGVSRKSVGRLLARRQASGPLEAKPRPGKARRIGASQHALVVAQMRAHPNASLEAHAALWHQGQGHSVRATTLWRTLRRMRWSHKKRVSRPVRETRRHAPHGATKRTK